jgi:steroid delta-isomerase-like uncharacterized protein
MRLTVGAEPLLEQWAAGWSAHDPERVASLYTDDCVYEDVPLGAVSRGRRELAALGRPFPLCGLGARPQDAFPDFGIELTAGFVAGDRAAMEWVMSGTHARGLPGVPASGRRFRVRGATMLELRDGRVTRNRDYWDVATLLTQVGLMP